MVALFTRHGKEDLNRARSCCKADRAYLLSGNIGM